MFDIGFSEMMVIGIVALIVLGPEKLPRVAKTMGHLMGRMQRYVNDVKSDINREIELDELRKFKQEVVDTAQSFKSEVDKTVHSFETTARDSASDFTGAVDGARQTIGDLTSLGSTPPPPAATSAAAEVVAPSIPVKPAV